MTHTLPYSQIFFITALVLAIVVMLVVFGRQIVKDLYGSQAAQSSKITSRDVDRYLMERGYVVCTVMPVKNTNKWLAFLIIKGKYEVVTLFTDGDVIVGHQSAML